MDRILGIIAEYNPFHNGHRYHLEESKRVTGCRRSICVMSGDFLQRGEPSIYDKWIRAEMAVRNGVDLVIELPFAFACNNAEYFARGAVGILDGLGCVTHIAFGSETGNADKLKRAAATIADEDREFTDILKRELSTGVSYPKARYAAYRQLHGEAAAEALEEPNDILAIEYIRQCLLLGSGIEMTAVTRAGSAYADKAITGPIASATAIRHKIINEGQPIESIIQAVPAETWGVLKKYNEIAPVGMDDFLEIILYKIISSPLSELKNIFSVAEGLENRLKKSTRHPKSNMRDLIKDIKTKRYTETRIQRILMHTMIGLTKAGMDSILKEGSSLYARVLAMNENGSTILKELKKIGCSKIPVITNINRDAPKYPAILELLAYDILASDIYNLARGADIYRHSDYVAKPFVL